MSTAVLANEAQRYILNVINQEDTLSDTLLNLGVIELKNNGEQKLDLPIFFMYCKIVPVIYREDLSELEIVNLLQNLDLNVVKDINEKYSQYLGKDLRKLNLTDEQIKEINMCIIFNEVYGISNNDDYINYLDLEYLYNKKKKKVSTSNESKIVEIKNNLDATLYSEYTLSSYYQEIDNLVTGIQKLGLVDFSNITYTLDDKTVVFPSPLQYINAATIVGISCQETSPNGIKTIVLPIDSDKPILGRKNRKTEQRIPTDLVRAKMFEVMLNSGFNPFTCFAIHDSRVSFGHTQAILNTYENLTYRNGKATDLSALDKNSISKFFDFFNKEVFLNLSESKKQFLQLPLEFEECVQPKDQILFSYYLALYNINKLMFNYMNPKRHVSERSFVLANAFSNASESERFRFVSAVTAVFHHIGEPKALEHFKSLIHTILPRPNNNPGFEEALASITLDDLTNKYLEILNTGAASHAETSMNVGEIVSRWQIEEELVAHTSSDTSSIENIKNKIGTVNRFLNNLFKRDQDSSVLLELEKPQVEITGQEEEGVTFQCIFGSKRNLIIQTNRTKQDIYGHEKDEFVDYYTFSYPQWGSPYYSFAPVLKESESDLILDIHKFNNLDPTDEDRKLRNITDPNSKDPMRTAMVFWVPVDYVKFEGPELGEIIITDNNSEKLEKALEEFCIGGASQENLKMIQLASNIHNMNEPNDRLLIPYSILKAPIKRKIDANSE